MEEGREQDVKEGRTKEEWKERAGWKRGREQCGKEGGSRVERRERAE